MKITLLANRDLASNLALNQLLPRLSQHHQLQVFLSSRVGSGTDLPEPLRLLKFFEQTLFNDILFPALDRCRSGNGPYSFAQLAQFAASPITVLNQINSEGGLATLAASSPDLIICIRYGGILKDRAIAIPRHGVINLHSGLLPDYRGVMATFRALLHGETEIGTTLHYISDGTIDTGDIIGNTHMPVTVGRSYLWHVLQLYPPACEFLLHTVDEISGGQMPACQSQPSGGSYYSFPDQAELDRFLQSGHSLYDINEITDIANSYLGVTTC
jgi:methionyl-tRNA formyltransferase